MGAGVNLALVCDVRLAGERARFDTRFLDLGLHPGGGHTWMFRRVAGPQAVSAAVLFGQAHNYGTSFQVGIGFAGIAVALLGRNHPVGIALGALVFSFLGEQANVLNILVGVSPDIVAVTQGIILLAVVIAYEVVRRYRLRLEQSAVAEQVAAPAAEEAKA